MRYILLSCFRSLNALPEAEKPVESAENTDFKEQLERLEKENRMLEAELKKEKLAFTKVKGPLEKQLALERLKLNQTLAESEARYKKISIQNKLLQAEQEQKQASLKAELENLKLHQAIAAHKHTVELTKIKQEMSASPTKMESYMNSTKSTIYSSNKRRTHCTPKDLNWSSN